MKNVAEKLNRVGQLLDGGELERDLALSLLREIYEELKFGYVPVAESEPFAAPAFEPEVYVESEHTVFEVEDLEPEPEPEFDPAPVEPQSVPVYEAPAPEPILEPQKPFVPRPAVKPEVIRSLYGDSATTLGDALRAEREDVVSSVASVSTATTLGDKLRNEGQDVASAAAAAATLPTVSLRKAIGLNDRFLMIRDMFRGDTAAFDRTIDQLDRFNTLDDAVIWLHDNFALNPDSEGVALLMNLLERRFA